MATVNILDLPASSIERIEELAGSPIDEWGSASKGKLYPALLHVIRGVPLAEAKAMPMRELQERIQVTADDEGEDGPGPASLGSPGR